MSHKHLAVPLLTYTTKPSRDKIRAGGVAQVVECLPNKNKVLSSNSSTARERENNQPSMVAHVCNPNTLDRGRRI
jgi:hypothetical protein